MIPFGSMDVFWSAIWIHDGGSHFSNLMYSLRPIHWEISRAGSWLTVLTMINHFPEAVRWPGGRFHISWQALTGQFPSIQAKDLVEHLQHPANSKEKEQFMVLRGKVIILLPQLFASRLDWGPCAATCRTVGHPLWFYELTLSQFISTVRVRALSNQSSIDWGPCNNESWRLLDFVGFWIM